MLFKYTVFCLSPPPFPPISDMSNHLGFKNTCNDADKQAISFSNFLFKAPLLFPQCFFRFLLLSPIEKLSATSSSKSSRPLLPAPTTSDKIPPTIVCVVSTLETGKICLLRTPLRGNPKCYLIHINLLALCILFSIL